MVRDIMAAAVIDPKRRLADLSIDEFLQHGFDSDIESGDDESGEVELLEGKEKPYSTQRLDSTLQSGGPNNNLIDPKGKKEKKKKKKKCKESSGGQVKSCGNDTKMEQLPSDVINGSNKEVENTGERTSKHKRQLEGLKDKDPSFYQFLLENDKELLNFDTSDDSDESGDLSDDNDLEDKVERGDTLEIQDKTDKDEDDSVPKKTGKKVTKERLQQWRKGLQKNSLPILKRVLSAFHSAVVELVGDDEKDQAQSKEEEKEELDFTKSQDFNALTQLCLKAVHPTLEHHFQIDAKTKPGKRPPLPSSNSKWTKIKKITKLYLKDLLQLLRHMAEADMLVVVLKHTQDMCPYFACYPQILKMFLKRLIRMWSAGEEHVSVLAFLNLRKCTLLMPMLFEFTLKNMYMGFVKNSKFVSPKSRPMLVFMQNSLIELFSMDIALTYQHGFMYIRQMAIHLRSAILNKKKESFKTIYNWQFISCLQLWTRVIGELYCDTLAPLVYPIVQITLGVIRLSPVMKYYPLRFLCLRCLNGLAQKTGTFIPLAPLLLEILESAEFNKKAKASTTKPPNISCALKVAKGELHTHAYKDAIVENICDIMLEHYTVNSSSIAFPELIFPSCQRMRKFNKSCHCPKYTKQIKQVIEKLEETGQEISRKRSLVTFSPKDIDQVRKWEEAAALEKNALKSFYKTWKELRSTLLATQEKNEVSESVESDEEDREAATKNKKVKKRKNTTRTVAKKNEDGGSKKKKYDDEDDIVEDFVLSDSDT